MLKVRIYWSVTTQTIYLIQHAIRRLMHTLEVIVIFRWIYHEISNFVLLSTIIKLTDILSEFPNTYYYDS